MSSGQGITNELGLGDVVSKTFDLYRRNFSKYLILFLVTEAIVGVFSTLVRDAIALPTLPTSPTNQQVLNWAPTFFGHLIALVFLVGIVGWVIGTVAVGTAVKLASEEIENKPVELGSSARFAVSKLVSIFLVGILVGIIVALGLIALIVPGIILAIMFSLVLPVIIVENSGVLASLGRSRKLVGSRWLKTLGLVIVFGIIALIASVIVGIISAPFGSGSGVVSSILSGFYLPIFPIGLTVYYYSNVARITPPTVSTAPMAPAPGVQTGMKFCPYCGTQLVSSAMFCSKCGAKQTA